MMKIIDSKYSILVIAVVCSIVILLNSYLIRVGIPVDYILFFWLPLLTLGFLMFFATFTFDSKYPLIIMLIFAFTLHLIQFVRQPSSLVWNSDSTYVFQVVEYVQKTGNFYFGLGTGMSPTYSLYPLFYIFLSALTSITHLSSMLIVKYSMAILNLATLVGFYAMLGLFRLNVKSKNLIACIFTLNPMFHYFNSYAHAESFAIIFYPLILLTVLKTAESRKLGKNSIANYAVIAIFLLLTSAMSHHFTSYMTAIALVVPTILMYVIFRKPYIRSEFCIMALVIPLTWLTFVAYIPFLSHLETLAELFSRLTLIHTAVGYGSSAIQTSYTHYPSVFSQQLTLIRNVFLVAITFFGFLSYIKSKKKIHQYFSILLIISSALAFSSLFLVDWSQIGSTPRTRLLEFAFFPIAIFFGFGVIIVLSKLRASQKRLKGFVVKLVVIIVFTTIFIPPTIFSAFNRFNYDPTYSPVQADEFDVAPETQYALGNWVLGNVNPFEKNVFGGSSSAQRYVIGYGHQEKWSLDIFNVTSIKEGKQQSWFEFNMYYVVNRLNIQLPDSYGRRIDRNITDFLDSNFNRIYDNGNITLSRQ